MERRRIIAIVVVVVLLAAGIGGYFWWRSREAGTDNALVISGTVDADQSQVAALVGGRVTKAEIAEGDLVEAGDVLYRLDARALKLQVDQAKAAVRAAKAGYDQAVDNDESSADVAAAKAQLDSARAAEKIAKVQLGYATVKAPAAGTITSIATKQGEIAGAGRTLATITEGDSLFVRSFVPEPRMGDVSVGDTVTIKTDGGVSTDAKVVFVASEAQFTPSAVETEEQRVKLVYEVRLVPSSTEGLTPGMPVTVTFDS